MRHIEFYTIPALLLVLTLMLGCSNDDSTGSGETAVDRVWVEKVTAHSGESDVRVGIQFENLKPISAIEAPLKIFGSGFRVDSVSFVGGRLIDPDILIGTIDTVEQTVVIAASFYDPQNHYLESGKGLLANIFFTLLSESAGQIIEIDSTTVSANATFNWLRFIDNTSAMQEIIPEFDAGEISVLY